ncbi:extracellular solute-binding protein [Paenibacillus flagellatus]|uniref:GntR family transcriptional regulator n=1 Tax=Paenibacillus flagellatus TaxID=2211139 RepID=A0A2V5KJS3_9BACL|nr:extracellular solute-binding protein [Paenibacillus flagellatus]PYI54910.1 GntR family transcriptional regulator [Paenibacillus flagellatus]
MNASKSRKSPRERLNAMVGRLRDEIAAGQRRAGEFLPSEKALAEQFELSNQSVRKGLDILVAEGCIEKIPRVGNKVVAPERSSVTTIKFGFHSSVIGEASLLQLIDMFQEANPHIRVQPVPMTSSSFHYIGQYFGGGLLDAVMMNYTDFRDCLESGGRDWLEPLPRNPELYSFLSDAFASDGLQLLQPFIFSPLLLAYNRAHFAEKGVSEPDSSWTWRDLIRTAQRLAVPNERVGFLFDLDSANRWPLLLLQSEATFERRADGSFRLDGTRMMETLRTVRDIKRDLSLLSEGVPAGEPERMLAKGKASMIVTSFFYLNYLQNESVPFDVAPVPHFGKPMSLLLAIGLAVNRQSNPKEKEAAARLLDYLTAKQAQTFVRRQTYSLPALRQAAEWVGEETMYRPSRFSLFRETIPGFRLFTELGIGAEELYRLNRELKLYWAGLESDRSLCAEIESWSRGGGA